MKNDCKYKIVEEGCELLTKILLESCPNSRERSIALMKIEEAIMWANASIAREKSKDNFIDPEKSAKKII